jgi:hypothetical protein
MHPSLRMQRFSGVAQEERSIEVNIRSLVETL